MSALRSALEEWVVEDVQHLHLDQLADDLVELEHVSGLLEVERLRRVSAFDDRSGPRHFGYPSLTAFLKHRCRMATGRAHRLVARSRVFRTARTTFRAWTAGRLSTDQAAILLDQAPRSLSNSPRARNDWSTSSKISVSPTPAAPSTIGGSQWTGRAPSGINWNSRR